MFASLNPPCLPDKGKEFASGLTSLVCQWKKDFSSKLCKCTQKLTSSPVLRSENGNLTQLEFLVLCIIYFTLKTIPVNKIIQQVKQLRNIIFIWLTQCCIFRICDDQKKESHNVLLIFVGHQQHTALMWESPLQAPILFSMKYLFKGWLLFYLYL